MAQKYDLLLVPTKSDKAIKQQPWYRERLRTKYIKQRKKTDRSENLIGRNWVLVRNGLDDFRDGKPLDFEGKYIMEGSKGISPIIKRSEDSLSSRLRRDKVQESHPRPKLTKSQMCFDKRLPQQRKRRDHIDELEFGLTQHPLALYPHLEEGMSPELFEKIVDLLDPAMNPEIESEGDETSTNTDRRTDSLSNLQRFSILEENEDNIEIAKKSSDDLKSRNPYKWILQKDINQKDDKKGLKKRPTSPSQDEHIKKVTKEFCDWVADLGGVSNNVEESTVMSLFASGYETKPALSVPIHVVELSHVPAELRISAGISPPVSAVKSHPPSASTHSQVDIPVPAYEPSWIKVNYGAWYLAPETWKVRGEHEPLEDPEEIAKREMSESKKKSMEMDKQLAPLHGARAFREFLERSERRIPGFMERVSGLQDEEDSKNEQIQHKAQSVPSRTSRSHSYRASSVAVSVPGFN